MNSELVLKDGALHRRTVVENFEPVELAQLRQNVDAREAEAENANANLLHLARNASSIDEFVPAREQAAKAEAALVEAKSELSSGESLVGGADATDTGAEEVDGDVENPY